MKTWIENELKGCEFPDVRLGNRFKMVIEQLATGIGRSLPFACQDWANTKAAYRFLDNSRISEADILKGHFQATHDRFKASRGVQMLSSGRAKGSKVAVLWGVKLMQPEFLSKKKRVFAGLKV